MTAAELAGLRAQIHELASMPLSDPAAGVRLELILSAIVRRLDALEAQSRCQQ